MSQVRMPLPIAGAFAQCDENMQVITQTDLSLNDIFPITPAAYPVYKPVQTREFDYNEQCSWVYQQDALIALLQAAINVPSSFRRDFIGEEGLIKVRFALTKSDNQYKFTFGFEGVPSIDNDIPPHQKLAERIITAGNMWFQIKNENDEVLSYDALAANEKAFFSFELVKMSNKSGDFRPSFSSLQFALINLYNIVNLKVSDQGIVLEDSASSGGGTVARYKIEAVDLHATIAARFDAINALQVAVEPRIARVAPNAPKRNRQDLALARQRMREANLAMNKTPKSLFLPSSAAASSTGFMQRSFSIGGHLSPHPQPNRLANAVDNLIADLSAAATSASRNAQSLTSSIEELSTPPSTPPRKRQRL